MNRTREHSNVPDLDSIAAERRILTSHKQRVVWARLTTVKRLLIRAGITTHDEFENMAGAMVNDINHKVLESVKADLGLTEEAASGAHPL